MSTLEIKNTALLLGFRLRETKDIKARKRRYGASAPVVLYHMRPMYNKVAGSSAETIRRAPPGREGRVGSCSLYYYRYSTGRPGRCYSCRLLPSRGAQFSIALHTPAAHPRNR